MATKQAKTLEQVQAEKEQLIKQLEELSKAEVNIIEESKAEAYESLLSVVAKYHLNGADVVNTLLNARKVAFKEIQEIKPIYLIKATVTKNKRGSTTGEKEQAEFFYYEGKVILADADQARQVCANGIDAFKKVLTENGNKYLTSDETKNILVNFYNEYKPSNVAKWDGQ